MGLVFAGEPIHGVVYILLSLGFSLAILLCSKKYTLLHTALISWFAGFVLLELVIGRWGVLPFPMLVYAIPMRLAEVFAAAFLAKRIQKDSHKQADAIEK